MAKKEKEATDKPVPTSAGVANAPSAGWQPAINQTLAEKMEGLLMAMFPIEDGTRLGEDGQEHPVTYCMVWDISGDEPKLFDKFCPISWQVVREQLKRSTPENPWVVGYVKQKGRAFIMDPPKPEEMSKIGTRLQAVVALIPLLENATEVPVEEEAF